jgi:hypothetical protein
LRKQIEAEGGLKLIYIDPPFDVGADFSMNIENGGNGWIGILRLGMGTGTASLAYLRTYNPAATLLWPEQVTVIEPPPPLNWYGSYLYCKAGVKLNTSSDRVQGTHTDIESRIRIVDPDFRSIPNGGKVSSARHFLFNCSHAIRSLPLPANPEKTIAPGEEHLFKGFSLRVTGF